ncbi:MAG: mucoidy inhibitor MuiA family protein, partial [Ignavibacteriae bacterium]|nr:mucoidy inhibitor MuiA family protein [Ignavibacteriota bacterium]
MRTALVLLLLSGFVLTAFAESEKSLQSKITSAIVYNDRALVTRLASGSFDVGKYNLKLPGLPILLNDQSVRIAGGGTAHAKILEVRVELALLDSVPDARVKELQNRMKAVQDDLRKLEDRGKTLTQQKEFLLRISIASSENISKDLRVQRPTVEDWQKVMAFLDASHSRFSAEQRELDAKKEELQRKLSELQFELDNIGTPKQPREKQVFVQLDVQKEGKLDLELSYLIQNASWEPLYDLRANTGKKKIELTYNAIVWQNTGEDWKDVTLTLSTAQPVIGGTQPVLGTWFIDVYGGTKGAIQGFVRDIATGEPLPGVNVTIEGKSQGASTNSDGFFVIQNVEPGAYSLKVSFVGYVSKRLQTQVVPYQSTRLDVGLDASNVEPEGVTVTAVRPEFKSNYTHSVITPQPGVIARAGRASEVAYTTDFESARVQSGATSTAFEIGAKATVPSNNTKRKVTITVASLDGAFTYSSVPKIQPRVYFKSTITNTTDFPLLAGSMSVFVDNNYVSNSHLGTVMPAEKFDAFLGVDDGVKIERKILNKLTEISGFFSKSRRTTYDILITVENLKKSAETVIVRDNI